MFNDFIQTKTNNVVNFNHPVDVISNLSYLKPSIDYSYLPDYPKAKIFCDGEFEIQEYCVLMGIIIFGKNCRVGPFSFLRGPLIFGDNVQIGPHCEITRSLIMDNVNISHKNIIVDSVIENNVWIAGFSTTCNKKINDENIKAWYKHQFIECKIKYGCFIEQNSKIGANVTIMPGTNVRGTVIGPSIVFGNNQIRSYIK